MASDQWISKQQHRAKDGKELPSGCDDGTGQGTKVSNGHEDKILKQMNNKKILGNEDSSYGTY